MRAEWLDNGKNNLPVFGRNRITFQIIELSVRIRIAFRIKSIEIHYLKEQFVVDIAIRNIIQINTGCIALIEDIQTESICLYVFGAIVDAVNIFHHQRPSIGLRRKRSRFQQFQKEGAVCCGSSCACFATYIVREFADLIYFSVVGIFVSHSQHFIRLECRSERDIAELWLQSVFRFGKQTGIFDLFVVSPDHHLPGQNVGCHTDFACSHIRRSHLAVKRICIIRRNIKRSLCRPQGIVYCIVFGHIGKGDDISCLIVIAPFVGDPNFDACNRYGRLNIRRFAHCFVKLIAKKITEKKMFVFVVPIGPKFKGNSLYTTL